MAYVLRLKKCCGLWPTGYWTRFTLSTHVWEREVVWMCVGKECTFLTGLREMFLISYDRITLSICSHCRRSKPNSKILIQNVIWISRIIELTSFLFLDTTWDRCGRGVEVTRHLNLNIFCRQMTQIHVRYASPTLMQVTLISPYLPACDSDFHQYTGVTDSNKYTYIWANVKMSFLTQFCYE